MCLHNVLRLVPWDASVSSGGDSDCDNCARIYKPSFHENKPKNARFMTENERFVLVFAKTVSINSGTGVILVVSCILYFWPKDSTDPWDPVSDPNF